MQLIINIFYYSLIYLLLGFSFNIIYNSVRFFHIAHAITITISSYFLFLFLSICNFNLLISFLISILLVITINFLIFKLIYNPLENKKVQKWQMLIASLGIYIIFQNLISIYFGDDTMSFRFWEIREGHQLLGAYISDVQIITIVVSIILLFLCWSFIEKTALGKRIKAVSSNPNLSAIFGISKAKTIPLSFTLGSVLAGIAGILIAADIDMIPSMGFSWLLYGVVAMIIGGMGKMHYLFMGALLLATAQHLSAYYIDSKWMNATAYIILIVFLFFKPYGFSGKKLKKAEL